MSAIAIAAFLNQRQKANDAAVESDVHNVALTIETMQADLPNPEFIRGTAFNEPLEISLFSNAGSYDDFYLSETVTLSEGVSIWVVHSGSQGGNYLIMGGHENGSKYVWDSAEGYGGLQDGKTLIYDSSKGGFLPTGTLVEDVWG